ncbi:DUF7262 family protein [Halosimplex halophilum]|uniref:DUF7262 family protein n=1 Tax=Halosimplex halophilum TaxID=2559572 RepID=UPI001FEAC939|nr:hypothetical protein [Halosimplex halophilum]
MADATGKRRPRAAEDCGDRGQLPMPAVEGALAVLLVLGVAAGFALGVPQPGGTQQLDAYAEDAATILAQEPPRHRGGTRLVEVMRSADAFERERDALDRRVGRILPDNVMFRVETPHGRAGYRKPARVPTGTATVTTRHGDLTIRVWYA